MTDEPEEEVNDESEDDYAPRIVVLGAGPVGVEAALYARYLGYEVAVIERGTVANNVLQWGHVRMFSPFAMNRSSLGAAALQAQDEELALPADDALLTGQEYAEKYLLPLSKTDLLRGCIHENVEAISIGRDGVLKTDRSNKPTDNAENEVTLDRSAFRFRVLVRSSSGEEDVIDADAVIDTTGVFDQPNYLGHGGIPAIGELACRSKICWHVPDVLGAERDRFENKQILVIGSGYSAATNVSALSELASSAKTTSVTWIVRRDCPDGSPIPVNADDRLPARSELAKAANSAAVRLLDQTSVLAISWDENAKQFTANVGGKETGDLVFDEVIANVGYRPNAELYSEIQIEICPSRGAPQNLSSWLDGIGNVDALDQTSPGADVLVQKEPNFYVLGSKSFGRNSNFLLALGLEQIRDAFTVIAGRDDLDLYKTMAGLVD